MFPVRLARTGLYSLQGKKPCSMRSTAILWKSVLPSGALFPTEEG